MNHVTVGVYPSGEYKVNIVRPEDLEEHISYNKTFRPGRMLFVDGSYVAGGMLKEERLEQEIKVWEAKINNMYFDTAVPSKVYC